jgi:ADP-ribose pyrophosphatase YjhB (NUDIX family)
MTNNEKRDLLKYDFDYNWKKIWLLKSIDNELHQREYSRSKKNYDLLKDGIISNNINISLEKIVEMSCNKYNEAEWGFPKGRKNLNENEITCAKREFYEETNISDSNHKILNIKQINELYMSTNKIKYNLIYYISQYTGPNDKLKINCNRQQQIEVSKSKWLNYYEILNKIRDYNIEKINVVNTIYYNIIVLITEIKNKIERII